MTEPWALQGEGLELGALGLGFRELGGLLGLGSFESLGFWGAGYKFQDSDAGIGVAKLPMHPLYLEVLTWGFQNACQSF